MLCIFASLLRFKTLNLNNESYKVVKDEFLSNRTFEDGQGVTFHALNPLDPTKVYDPDTTGTRTQVAAIFKFSSSNIFFVS